MVEREINTKVPATYLQEHDDVNVILDKPAAALLARIKTPWLTGFPEWTDFMRKNAVAWLSGILDKPILKLTDKDYNDNGIGELVADQGPSYDINIKVFNELQHTITGWPGGKPDADDSQRPERASPARKRVIVFSPHPAIKIQYKIYEAQRIFVKDPNISGGLICRVYFVSLVHQAH